MFGRPRQRRAARQPKAFQSAAWRSLAALLLVFSLPAGGWRSDRAHAAVAIDLQAPPAGATVPADASIRFAWSALAAAAYRVVFDEGERTGPWVARPAWDAGPLPPGRYRWRVAARTPDGLIWSDERTLAVGDGVSVGPLALPQPAAAPRLDLAASGAVAGTRLTVTGSGFAPGETVDLTWERAGEPAPERATAGDDGDWTTPVLVPDLPGGGETLAARGATSGTTASAPLAILPSLERTPAGGPPGAAVEIDLRGFAANEQVALRWNDAGPPLATALTHGDGAARIRFAVPDEEPGVGELVAVGQSSGARASTTLRVDPMVDAAPDATPAPPERPTIGADTTVGPGMFAVTAAQTGTVGGTTASGHLIAPDDRFAALPICLTTSCPWLDPGVNHPLWGVRVECGAACAVRVADPATGRCAVAPVLDVGPWFSDDDWWEAAPRRRINRVDGAVYTLATGYAAAAAAHDGYDVGFGRAANGVGISDRGYEVGDGAALGLAAGSWADLGLPPDRAAAPVEATLLWLTGEDPATEAAACETANAALPPVAPAATPAAPVATPLSGAPAPIPASAAPADAAISAPPDEAVPTPPASPIAAVVTDVATVAPDGTPAANDDPPAKNDIDRSPGAKRAEGDAAPPVEVDATKPAGSHRDQGGDHRNGRNKKNDTSPSDPAG